MNCFVGIDLGGTIVKIGLVKGGRILDSCRLDADSKAGLSAMLPQIGDGIDKMLNRSLHDTDELAGVSLAFPGIVDFSASRAAATNAKYNDAPSVDMKAWVLEKYGVPFHMDNDARMAMVGEWKAGAGKGHSNMVMMTIGTGIGTGVVVDSRPLYGSNNCAGSLGGHLTIDYRGRRCTCGNVGCVEAHSSSFFLPEIIKDNYALSESFRCDTSNFNFKAIFDKYRQGDADARPNSTYKRNF